MRTTELCVTMKLYHSILLCLACYICGLAAVSWSSSCCQKKSNHRIPVRNVVGCMVQQAGICAFNAIKINTNKGRTVCFDLDSVWVSKNVVVNGTACQVPKKKKKRGRKRSKKQILFTCVENDLFDDIQDFNTDT